MPLTLDQRQRRGGASVLTTYVSKHPPPSSASVPQGIDTTTDLLKIGDALRERGYSDEDIAAVLGGNMLRKLRQCLPED